jgi:undecaprenyl-diphosphatase
VSYLQAFVIALVQGVTELFPVSSLGHSVLLPAWIGGSWQTMVTQSSQADSGSSFYLAYIVALHCATALALLWFFRADWARIIRGFFSSIRDRRVETSGQRLAWMIVLATIPVGVTGIALEHTFRTLFAKPAAAAVFLFINGLILLAAERRRRAVTRAQQPTVPLPAVPGPAGHQGAGHQAAGYQPPRYQPADFPAPGRPAPRYQPGSQPRHQPPGYEPPRYQPPGYQAGGHRSRPVSHARRRGGRDVADIRAAELSDVRIARLSFRDSLYVGVLQIAALLAGISRSGVTMAGGLRRGLDHEDAARFAFLLATPPILAAGVLKLPSLAGPAGARIHGQVLLGVVVTAITAYLSVRFLVRYFQTRTLTPFAIYCLALGALSIARFAF